MIATLTTSQVLLGSLFGAVIYLVGVLCVAALLAALFGDAPLLVVIGAVFWPGLLIPMLIAVAGYRLGGGHKVDAR